MFEVHPSQVPNEAPIQRRDNDVDLTPCFKSATFGSNTDPIRDRTNCQYPLDLVPFINAGIEGTRRSPSWVDCIGLDFRY
jgi:hypothetical protein